MQHQKENRLPRRVPGQPWRCPYHTAWHIWVGCVLIASLALVGASGVYGEEDGPATSSHSTTIALTADDQRVVVVNRQNDSVSIIAVRNDAGHDVYQKLEIGRA